MYTRRDTFAKAAALMAAIATRCAGKQAAGSQAARFSVPFEYAADRGSLLLRAHVNQRPAVLIFDTGSRHTILRPELLGIRPSDLASPRAGAGVIGDAVGREVTLEVGSEMWQRRRVSVMDLSSALDGYRERIDGLLGLDFLFEFSQAVIALKDRTVTFVR